MVEVLNGVKNQESNLWSNRLEPAKVCLLKQDSLLSFLNTAGETVENKDLHR